MTSEAPTFAVDCGGHRHTLRLDGSRLVAEEHDEDAEIAVARLGGDAPRCVAIVDAWRARDVMWTAGMAEAMRGDVDDANMRSVLEAGAGGARRQLLAIPGGAAVLGEQMDEVDEMERQCRRLLVLFNAPLDIRRAYVELMSRGD